MQSTTNSSMEKEEEEFPIGLACALDEFRHKDEVLAHIKNLPQIYQNASKLESDYQAFMKILDLYQEQAGLLTSSIQELIAACLDITMSHVYQKEHESLPPGIIPLKYLSLKYLRHIFKVYRVKRATKFMPHEVTNVAPVLHLLESINLEDSNFHESASVLIYWMSILVLNPFELSLLDGTTGQEEIAQRILNVCMTGLVLNNSAGNAVPTLLAKLLTRPDMLKRENRREQVHDLNSFIDWCCGNMGTDKRFPVRAGAISALAAIFKQAKREEICLHGRKVLSALLASKFEKGDTLLRKYGVKLIQRVGMIFLKPRVAIWRYNRGSRSLIDNLQPSSSLTSLPSQSQTEKKITDEEDDETEQYEDLHEFSSEIESILDIALKGLDDKDTIVRNSAAKGVGRIVNRLPRAYGSEVVENILHMMSPTGSSGAWAGACMALAELARKGLLLPKWLDKIVPAIQKAMFFEEIGGSYGGGRQVRDCACYVMHSFARCFEPNIMKPHVDALSTSLLLVTVFDREINCRRAAAAAFQENVGRQGNFPHGMDIIELADYTTVANRTNSYTKVSVEVAKFSEYLCPMTDHLTTVKFCHTDPAIRELTAAAMNVLTPLDLTYVADFVLKRLLLQATKRNVEIASGALLCLASIIEAKDMAPLLTTETRKEVHNVSRAVIESLHSYSIAENILLRSALNNLIRAYASKIGHFGSNEFPQLWLDLLNDNIFFNHRPLQKSAAEAFQVYLNIYNERVEDLKSRSPVELDVYVSELTSPDETKRVGAALVFANLPIVIIKSSDIRTVLSLIKCATIDPDHAADWIESRRIAFLALSSFLDGGVLCHFGGYTHLEGSQDPVIIYNVIMAGLHDYTTDKRGDIGSMVREGALRAAKTLLQQSNSGLMNKEGQIFNLYDDQELVDLMAAIARQCVEKIDNLRIYACGIFFHLFHVVGLRQILVKNGRLDPTTLAEKFPEDVGTTDWRNTSSAFKRFANALSISEFRKEVLTGFVTTGGSLGGTAQMDAFRAVYDHISNEDESECENFTGCLLEIFKENLKNDRISLPLMKFSKLLLENDLLDLLHPPAREKFGLELIELVKTEIYKSTNVEKIMAGIDIMVELFQGSEATIHASLKRLVISLGHPYPRVRKFTAERILSGFIAHEENMLIEKIEDAKLILEEVRWESPLPIVKPKRDEFCHLINIPIPVPPPPSQTSSTSTSASASASVTSLKQ